MRILTVFISLFFLISCGGNSNDSKKTEEQPVTAEVREEVLHIGKMHCDMCAASIEKGIGSVEGVEFVKVSLEDSTATVKYVASETMRDQLRQAIEKRGYVLKDN